MSLPYITPPVKQTTSGLSLRLKFAKAPCLSPWERCLKEAERVNCTIVTRTNFVTTNALPSVFVGNDPVSFRL